MILFFFGCSEVSSTWLIIAEIAKQRERKVLFTCVAYTKGFFACGPATKLLQCHHSHDGGKTTWRFIGKIQFALLQSKNTHKNIFNLNSIEKLEYIDPDPENDILIKKKSVFISRILFTNIFAEITFLKLCVPYFTINIKNVLWIVNAHTKIDGQIFICECFNELSICGRKYGPLSKHCRSLERV